MSIRRKMPFLPLDHAGLSLKSRNTVPHEFVLDAIAALSPRTRPMFGCLAVYLQRKIVLILRDKPGKVNDNGVWLATTRQHHESLRRDFPNMRSVQMFGKEVTDWQVLSTDSPDFEEASLRACQLIVARDPRIGKIPTSRKASGPGAKSNTKSPKRRKGSAGRARRPEQ
jgi:hypothetical protein